MYRLIPILLLCTAATAQSSAASAGRDNAPVNQGSPLRRDAPVNGDVPADKAAPADGSERDGLALPPAVAEPASTKLPPAPAGKSTVVGGQIGSVDPVRDRILLKVYGGHTMPILFDERTQVFRDGVRSSVLSLRRNERASIETTLDGSSVFALRIHMLSHTEEGECRGQVVSYAPESGELRLELGMARQPLTLRVTGLTSVVHVGQDAKPGGQAGPSDLVTGAIVFAKFTPGSAGQGLATRVEVIASPGSTFVFAGPVTFLDVRAGRLVVADGHFAQPREIVFAPAGFPIARELHEGSAVKVTTTFDGARFTASQIEIN